MLLHNAKTFYSDFNRVVQHLVYSSSKWGWVLVCDCRVKPRNGVKCFVLDRSSIFKDMLMTLKNVFNIQLVWSLYY